MPGFQHTKATRISSGVQGDLKLIEAVAAKLTLTSGKPKVKGGKFSGSSFCFTGTMQRPRKELEALVVDNGGICRSVSKELTYLVADPMSMSSKAVKARRLGVKLISEADFLKMVK